MKMQGVNYRVFFRSFFLESVWNYERMQNIGFVFCVMPVIRRLYPDKVEQAEAIARHSEPVNTHPAMSTMLIGLTAALERDLDPSTVLPYRKRIMSALAAHGDKFFWGGLKPLSSVWAMIPALLMFGPIVVCPALLLLYNIPNLAFRYIGFGKGWNEGLKLLQEFKSPEADVAILTIKAAIAFGLGIVVGILAFPAADFVAAESGNVRGIISLAIPGLIFAVLIGALRRRLSFAICLYIAMSIAVVLVLLVFMDWS